MPHAAARAQALEEMLTTAQRWAQLEARRADRLHAENQLLRALVAAATRYQHPDAPRAVVDKVSHNPTWRVRRLGAGDSGEDYEDLDAALARARELGA